jgi:hypothetical protein
VERESDAAVGQGQVRADERSVAAGQAGGAGELADEDGRDGALDLDLRQLGVVLEGGVAVPCAGRLGDPQLDALELAAVVTRGLSAVADAVPAVMRLSCPGAMTCSLPRLSRCSTWPSTSQVAVCRPMCG